MDIGRRMGRSWERRFLVSSFESKCTAGDGCATRVSRLLMRYFENDGCTRGNSFTRGGVLVENVS